MGHLQRLRQGSCTQLCTAWGWGSLTSSSASPVAMKWPCGVQTQGQGLPDRMRASDGHRDPFKDWFGISIHVIMDEYIDQLLAEMPARDILDAYIDELLSMKNQGARLTWTPTSMNSSRKYLGARLTGTPTSMKSSRKYLGARRRNLPTWTTGSLSQWSFQRTNGLSC